MDGLPGPRHPAARRTNQLRPRNPKPNRRHPRRPPRRRLPRRRPALRQTHCSGPAEDEVTPRALRGRTTKARKHERGRWRRKASVQRVWLGAITRDSVLLLRILFAADQSSSVSCCCNPSHSHQASRFNEQQALEGGMPRHSTFASRCLAGLRVGWLAEVRVGCPVSRFSQARAGPCIGAAAP